MQFATVWSYSPVYYIGVIILNHICRFLNMLFGQLVEMLKSAVRGQKYIIILLHFLFNPYENNILIALCFKDIF